MNSFLGKISNKWQEILAITIMAVAIAFSISAVIPPRYKSSVNILVFQDYGNNQAGALSTVKIVEYISGIFSEVIYTDSFVLDAQNAPFDIKNQIPRENKARKKFWEKSVKIEINEQAGMLSVDVFSRSKEEAENIANAVAWNFANNGNKYHGLENEVKFKLINGPITSRKPAEPNLGRNTLVGVITGLAGSLLLIFCFENFDLKFIQRKKEEEEISRWGENIREKLKSFSKIGLAKQETSEIKEEPKEELGQESVPENLPIEEEPKIEEIKEEPMKAAELVRANIASSKKAAAPENLPFVDAENFSIFSVGKEEPEEINPSDSSAGRPPAGGKEAKESKLSEDAEREPTEEEVKERLNKLLRGEL